MLNKFYQRDGAVIGFAVQPKNVSILRACGGLPAPCEKIRYNDGSSMQGGKFNC